MGLSPGTVLGFAWRLVLTLCVFYGALEWGKKQREADLVPCPEYAYEVRVQEIKSDNPLPKCTTKKIYDHCMESPYTDNTFLHVGSGTIPQDVFNNLHHPASPAKSSYIYTQSMKWDNNKTIESQCSKLYLTRTGSRQSQPNKCVAVSRIPEGVGSIVQHSYRTGYTALLTNQYLNDYARGHTFKEEIELLPPILNNLPKLIELFISKMGNPIKPDGSRRTAIVMVANDGVMDLMLNFMCSAEASGIDLSSIVVFVGTDDMLDLIEGMGAQAIYSPDLGSMPKHAAGSYLDSTFARMMWFKVTSVFLALTAGFEVLFQDVDLVWMNDPVPYLRGQSGDILFMDDGARTPRYTPFFVNSGFYYMKHNERTTFFMEKMIKSGPSEIGYSHSHQAVLIRHLAECVHFIGLQINVLNTDLFPSGQAYHERKNYIKKIQNHEFLPYVFHMCWTDNRENKVVYFKDVGLWYLPDEDPTCTASKGMLNYLQNKESSSALRDLCCKRERYYRLITDVTKK